MAFKPPDHTHQTLEKWMSTHSRCNPPDFPEVIHRNNVTIHFITRKNIFHPITKSTTKNLEVGRFFAHKRVVAPAIGVDPRQAGLNPAALLGMVFRRNPILPVGVLQHRVVIPTPPNICIHLVGVDVFQTNPRCLARVEGVREHGLFFGAVESGQESTEALALEQCLKEVHLSVVHVQALVSCKCPSTFAS